MCLHFFKKQDRRSESRAPNLPPPSVLPHLRTPMIHLQGNIYWRRPYLFINAPFQRLQHQWRKDQKSTTPRQPNWRHHSPRICKKDELDLKEALRQQAASSNQPVRRARRLWYHILSELFWRRDPNSRNGSDSPAHSYDELLPRACHKKRGSKPQHRSCLLKIERTRNQIARPSWSKNRTCHPRWRHLVMATNTSQQILHNY